MPNQPGFDWNRIRALPEVEALTTFPAYSGLSTDAAPGDTPNPFVPADTEAMRTIETPIVLAGRLANPARPDEAVVTPAFVRSTGRGVGDTVTARLTTPEQASATFNTSQNAGPAGPAVRLRIVGVVRSLWYGDDIGGHGVLIPSPGLVARYRANFLGAAGDVPLNAIVVFDMDELAGHYRSVTGFESACLLAFALAAFLAGLVLAGQAIARLVAASAAELRLATALGLTRAQGTAVAAAGPVAAGVTGTSVGVVLAIVASRWMPFGVAATKRAGPGRDRRLAGTRGRASDLSLAGGGGGRRYRMAGPGQARQRPRRPPVHGGSGRRPGRAPRANGGRRAVRAGAGPRRERGAGAGSAARRGQRRARRDRRVHLRGRGIGCGRPPGQVRPGLPVHGGLRIRRT